MILQVSAAALVSENKSLAFPASVDSIPTSAGQEDHVSMATHGALKARRIAHNAAGVVGIELLAAAQGIDFHAPLATSAPLARAHAAIRARCRSMRRTAISRPTSPGRKRRCWTAPLRAPSRPICSIAIRRVLSLLGSVASCSVAGDEMVQRVSDAPTRGDRRVRPQGTHGKGVLGGVQPGRRAHRHRE